MNTLDTMRRMAGLTKAPQPLAERKAELAETVTSGKLAAKQAMRANNQLDGTLDALAQLGGALRSAGDDEGHRLAQAAIRKTYAVKAVMKELRGRAFDAQRSGK